MTRGNAFHRHIARKRSILATIEGWSTMNTYDVWCPLISPATRNAQGVVTQAGSPVMRVKAPDSFTARRDFAAMYAGMEATDVAASRVWLTEACED